MTSLSELKKQSSLKVLIRGKSSYGKTLTACKIALSVADSGARVRYVDTEEEAAETLIGLVEDGENEEALENIDYVQVADHDEIMDAVDRDEQTRYGLLVVDTLDDKHTMAINHVMGEMAAGGDDFGLYPRFYSEEKKLMYHLRKPRTNILACLDPDSGKMDKPKDCQVNVHGRFSVVVDLIKNGDEHGHKVRNWIMGDKVIGKSLPNFPETVADKILERV